MRKHRPFVFERAKAGASVLIKIGNGAANDGFVDDEFLIDGGGHEGGEAKLIDAAGNAFGDVEDADEGFVRK